MRFNRAMGLLLASSLWLGVTAHADTVSLNESGASKELQARNNLAKKLMRLSQSLDVKEKSLNGTSAGAGAGTGGKDFNSNDGNSFSAVTTYHSYVWDYCEQWIGGQYCDKWRAPYVSGHGLDGGDFSPLEGLIGQEWKRSSQIDNGNQFAIWRIDRAGGNTGKNVDADGKLNREGITNWELRPDVKAKVEKLGTQAATRQLSLTYDDSTGKGQNVMPNIESMRMMASYWTKALRNRLVANLGELRAASKPVEFALGEDKARCEDYLTAMQNEAEETGTEERIQSQGRLDPETNASTLQERFKRCAALRRASVASVNPTVDAQGRVTQGDADGEQVDKWRSRINIAMIDYAGINPNSLAKPRNAVIKKSDYTNQLTDHEVGGLKLRKPKYLTNAEQISQYNDNLERAAIGMQEVAMRSGKIVDNSQLVRKQKIKVGSTNLVSLNGLTREMRGNLSDTVAKKMPAVAVAPTNTLEDSPSQLTVRSLQ